MGFLHISHPRHIGKEELVRDQILTRFHPLELVVYDMRDSHLSQMIKSQTNTTGTAQTYRGKGYGV